MVHLVREARLVMKRDLNCADNQIRIMESVRYTSAIQPSYTQYEYGVMPFGLTNGPATFQSYIDDCLGPYIDQFAVYYLDNMFIYSTNM
jgi:hypothetical protein